MELVTGIHVLKKSRVIFRGFKVAKKYIERKMNEFPTSLTLSL